jgi:hypothetical protein
MQTFCWITSGGTRELLPCELEWSKLVKFLRKPKSKYYWYEFTIRGRRFRGSTQETKATKAAKVVGLKLARPVDGLDPVPSKPVGCRTLPGDCERERARDTIPKPSA